jgi:hypothetical protein
MTKRVYLLFAFALVAGNSCAQSTPDPVPPPAPFGSLPIRFFGEMRERYENPELPLDKAGNVDVRYGALPFFFSRIRLGALAEPLPYFSARVEIQDTRFWGEEQGTLNNLKGVDLHVGYLQLGDAERFVRLGRQVYGLGEERLFGEDNWYDPGRVFDMIRFRSPLLGGTYVGEFLYAETTNPIPDNVDEAFELVQLSRLLPREGYLQVYGVEKHDSHQGPITHNKLYIVTLGLHAHVNLDPFLVDLETAGQAGEHFDDIQRAAFVAGFLRRTWSGRHPVTLGIEGSWGSGQTDPASRVNAHFDLLYPSRHGKYGFLDLLSLQNNRQAAVTLDVPGETPGDSLHFAVRYLAVDNSHDAWINSRGETIGRVPDGSAGRSIGWEFDIGLARRVFRQIDLTIALDGGYLIGGQFARAVDHIVQAYAGTLTMTYRFWP